MIREIEQLISRGYTVSLAEDSDENYTVKVQDEDGNTVAENVNISLYDAVEVVHRDIAKLWA